MGLRDVLITLRLNDSQFRARIAAASAQTKAFAAETTAAGTKGASGLGLLSSRYTTLGLGAAAVGLQMVRSAATFEQAMANVNATGAATGRELGLLREQALDFGRTTTYSATEAAGGIEALLKAGLSARDVMGKKGGLAASLSLAAASNLDVAGASEAVSIALQQFNLDGQQAAHVSDLLAAGAGKSVGEVSDLSMALNQSGLVARSAGLSIEETVGTLSQFAAAGLIGSDAGTSFKTMLQRLANPTKEAAALINELNISAYDSQGNFIGMTNYAGKLQDALAGMSQEQRQATLATIFGSDAVRAATVLFEGGAKGSAKWTKAVDDAGYAADVAGKKTDTLAGDLDKLKNSWDALSQGSDGASGLRPLIQSLDDLTDVLGKVDKATPDFLKQSPLASTKDALDKARITFGALNRGLDPNVVVKFKTEGAANAIRDAANVANALNLTPTQVRSYLELRGWSPQAIDTVLTRMGQVDGKRTATYLELMGYDVAAANLDDVNGLLLGLDGRTVTSQVNADPSGAVAGAAQGQGAIDSVEQTNIPDIWSDPSGAITGGRQATDAVNSVPDKRVRIDGDASSAKTAAREAKAAMDSVPDVVTKVIKVVKKIFDAEGGAVGGYADGGEILTSAYASGGRARGAIRGPGGPKQDLIDARLSHGEHVFTASDVRKAGGQDAMYAMRAAIQAGRLRFADGGYPAMAYSQPAANSLHVTARASRDLYLKSGELTIRGGKAYIEGVVVDVLTDEVTSTAVGVIR